MRRKRFEARLVAAELAPLLAGMWGGSQQGPTSNKNGRIPAEQMFAEMGIEIK